jgi:U3 small nucleolar RNA-associated protein MPP10
VIRELTYPLHVTEKPIWLAANDDDPANQEESLPCSLSGLHSLYTGVESPQHEKSNNSPGSSNLVDIETIWGQVDLQNNALLPLLKKLTRKLAKHADSGEVGASEIRLLDMSAMSSDDEQGDGVSDSEGNDDEENVDEGSAASNLDEEDGDQSHESDDDDDEELNDDARRIRERMKKAMADMDDSGDDFSEDEKDEATLKAEQLKTITAKAKEMEESIIDPTREEMRDGFFDLHEMEAFADEEEEYLPDEAYGAEMENEEGFDDSDDKVNGKKKQKNKKKMLPHIRDRMGESDSDSDENSDDENSEDELTKRFKPNTVRRKKYRADDEVEALYELYNDKLDDDYDQSDDEEEFAVENITAVDFFGKPDEKLIEHYKSNHREGAGKGIEKGGQGFGETDSWEDHNFGEDGADWKDNDDEDEVDGPEESEEEEEEPDDDEEEAIGDGEPHKLSSHGLQSKKLEQYTLRIEEELMAEKPWKMRGETRGTDRPADSLLDSTPEFEVAFKPPPIITAEHTASIEEMIKKRIIEEDWDDVVPRELPDIGLHKRGGGDPPEVSQEKSKLGLGELYEREYLKKTAGFDRDAHEKETEEGAAKEEMKKLFANLCSKLDALSNYHFAPRPVADEADINKQDVPAIAMEEVLPLHVSTSRGMAPEEVYAGGKGRASVLKGESELDQVCFVLFTKFVPFCVNYLKTDDLFSNFVTLSSLAQG